MLNKKIIDKIKKNNDALMVLEVLLWQHNFTPTDDGKEKRYLYRCYNSFFKEEYYSLIIKSNPRVKIEKFTSIDEALDALFSTKKNLFS